MLHMQVSAGMPHTKEYSYETTGRKRALEARECTSGTEATCAQVAESGAAHFMSERDEAFMEQRSATRIMRSRLRPSSLGLRLRWPGGKNMR
jgi:hypothetical protein